MINWKVRIKNKTFWLAIVPAIFLLVQSVAAVFGIELDMSDTVGKLVDVVESLFVVLTILGIVVDPTTVGIPDSDQALGYEVPRGV